MEKKRLAPQRPVIIIPARMSSRRLPGKPLADIHGIPMIIHVWQRAVESKIGPVVVACDGGEIANAVKKVGGKAILTKSDHPSGSDRIWEALGAFEKEEKKENGFYDAVINVQGDLPTLDPAAIHKAYDLLKDSKIDIATLVVEIKNEAEKTAPQVVKAAIDMKPGEKKGRAFYFSRHPIPFGEGPLYHHIGLYAFRRDALGCFVAASPSALEKRESLEQLRALSLDLHIGASVIDTVPLGVDTKEDLEKARDLLRQK